MTEISSLHVPKDANKNELNRAQALVNEMQPPDAPYVTKGDAIVQIVRDWLQMQLAWQHMQEARE